MGDQLAVVAAPGEELLRTGLLEIAAPDLRAGDLRCDRQHRDTAAVALVEAVDQMQVAGTAAAGAHRQLAREVGFRSGGKRCHLLVPHVGPFELLRFPDGIRDAVERVAGHAVDPPYACFRENVDQLCRYRLPCHSRVQPPCRLDTAVLVPILGWVPAAAPWLE